MTSDILFRTKDIPFPYVMAIFSMAQKQKGGLTHNLPLASHILITCKGLQNDF